METVVKCTTPYFALKLYETVNPVSEKAYFAVPHKPKPMMAKALGEHFCKDENMLLKDLFDGSSIENTLAAYYKKTPKPKKSEDIDEYHALYQGADYIFIGPDEEEEFAEIMGVKLYDADKEPKSQKAKRVALTEEQIAIHHENIADIRKGLAKFTKLK